MSYKLKYSSIGRLWAGFVLFLGLRSLGRFGVHMATRVENKLQCIPLADDKASATQQGLGP